MFIGDVLTLTAFKDCPAKTNVPPDVFPFKDAAVDELAGLQPPSCEQHKSISGQYCLKKLELLQDE